MLLGPLEERGIRKGGMLSVLRPWMPKKRIAWGSTLDRQYATMKLCFSMWTKKTLDIASFFAWDLIEGAFCTSLTGISLSSKLFRRNMLSFVSPVPSVTALGQ